MKRQFYYEAKFMKDLRHYYRITQIQVSDSLKMHGQSISNLERGASGMALKNWLALSESYAFIWSDLAEAISMDEKLFVQNFKPDLTKDQEPSEIIDPTSFNEHVENLYQSKV